MKKLTILLLLIASLALPMAAQPMTSLGTYGASGVITGWNAEGGARMTYNNARPHNLTYPHLPRELT